MAEPDSASLAGALDRVLEKGVVVDVQARISLVGIDVMTVEGQVVAASLDTYYENREEIAAVERAGPGGSGGAADTGEVVGDVVDTATDAVDSATESVGSDTGELSAGGGSGSQSSADPGNGGMAAGDAPEGKVRCRECGETFEAITPSHLATHDTTVEAYREQFGEDVPMNFGGI
jgi:hypothetical protein